MLDNDVKSTTMNAFASAMDLQIARVLGIPCTGPLGLANIPGDLCKVSMTASSTAMQQ